MSFAFARLLRLWAAAGCLCILGACASAGSAEQDTPNPDPLEPVNRVVYRFNDVADEYVGKPVARGYRRATPQALRHGIGNLIDNARYPITIVNDFLQGKLRQGGADLARFIVNSTIGLAGLFDPASTIGLREHHEDFGQTLVVWGVTEGPYLVVPIFGPHTVTSGVGELAGTQVSLLTQLPDEGTPRTLTWAGHLIHRRYELLGADEEIERAFDPYAFVRDAWLQNRRYRIYDGNVPEDDLYPEDEFED